MMTMKLTLVMTMTLMKRVMEFNNAWSMKSVNKHLNQDGFLQLDFAAFVAHLKFNHQLSPLMIIYQHSKRYEQFNIDSSAIVLIATLSYKVNHVW